MYGLPYARRRRWVSRRPILLFINMLTSILIMDPLMAADQVYIDVVPRGQTKPVSNLFVGLNYEFRVWVENDVPITSMRITLRNWVALTKNLEPESEMGSFFSWLNVGGYGPTGLSTGHACVTVVPGSRLDPPEYVWDYSNTLRVWEYNMNEISPDTIGFGGTAINHGLPAGPLQHMASVHFKPNLPSTGQRVLYLDSASVSPGGGVVFFDGTGIKITPQFSTASPWFVTTICGDVNADGVINITDAVYLVRFIFKGGPAPLPSDAGDVNCIGDVNISDAVHLINYIFKGGPAPCCI